MSEPTKLKTQCCIAGGGPAGMVLGVLLARAGVKTLVLEKHADFLRDFRGDTIHPSSLEVMHELGILDRFLELPHQRVDQVGMRFGDTFVRVADLRHLPTVCKFIAFMPQWDFLDFLADYGRSFDTFDLRMQAEASDLIVSGDTVTGVRATTAKGEIAVDADLVVAADGRDSTLRQRSGLLTTDLGAPMDVLWFRLPRVAEHGEPALLTFGAGHVIVLIDRGEYWQCGFVHPKGSAEQIRAAGLEAFRNRIATIHPALGPQLATLDNWEDIRLLTVQVNRLEQWCIPGFLCIGDAAHAMSPVGGIGINLAIQDAVATANLLAAPLKNGRPQLSDLEKVQARRLQPTRLTQQGQLAIQNRIISGALDSDENPTPPLLFKLFDRFEFLRRIPGRVAGIGLRPEHVEN